VWTAGQNLNYSVPSNVTSLTILGAGSQSTTGGGDQTIIIDNTRATTGFNINIGAGQFLRVSGLTFEYNASTPLTTNGAVGFGGKGTLRVDHVHFWDNGNPTGFVIGVVYGSLTGVFDHDLLDERTGTNDNGIRVLNGETAFGDVSNNGNLAWSNPTNVTWQQGIAIYFEDNVYNGGISNDCNHGGRQVFRHNTFNHASIQTHEMTGDGRGCRFTELYNNSFNGSVGDAVTSYTAMGCRMGPCIAWGNTSSLMANFISLQHDRTNGHPFAAPPSGYGYCGTLGVDPGPSNWDGNSTTTVGYPCLDQPGRGQSDVLSGNFPTKCDVTTFPSGCSSSWPHNLLEPIYEWRNQFLPGEGGGWVHGLYNPDNSTAGLQVFRANRDYYAYTLAWNGSAFTGTAFNGTVGTGSGLLSARPSTCTAGMGGTYGASPTGSFGVGYWATDTNTLYICTATNTWTAYYTPYTYPHPLVTGSQTSGAPQPPTNLVVTVN
jgi:hypothetical protein